MKFPNWAPKRLVDYYQRSIDTIYHPIEFNKKNKLSTKQKENLNKATKSIASMFHLLPDEEANNLLRKYISDERMRTVWTSLDKRITDENCYNRFFIIVARE